MKMKYYLTKIFLLSVILCINTGFAQLSAYHGIVFPYEQQTLAGKSLGGASVAVPDYVPDARGNPAGLAFSENIQFFAGINTQRDNYKLDYQFPAMGDAQKSKLTYTRNQFFPSNFSLAIPFDLKNKKAAVTLSVNKINIPEIATMDIPEIKRDLDYDYTSNGDIWNSSLAAGIKLNENLSVGFSWTKWFGKWNWETENIIVYDSTYSKNTAQGTHEYSGNSFSLGVVQRIHKLSIGLVLHSPFTLMKADKVIPDFWLPSDIVNMEQQYKGAVSVGLAYRVSQFSRIGLGYRYQDKFTIQETPDWEDAKPINFEYSNAHKVSISGEYAFHIFSLRVPVFLTYSGQWLPVSEESWSRRQTLLIKEKNRFQNSVAMGLQLGIKNMDFYFVTSLNQYTFKGHHFSNPPYS